MRLVFWHNIISPHQAPFVRELSNIGHECIYVTQESMSADRQALGWTTPELGNTTLITDPDAQLVRQLITTQPADSIHVIAGARGTQLGRTVARFCIDHKSRMGIITESPDPRGLAGILRYFKYRLERHGRGRHFDFILAMGNSGQNWFLRCGYPPNAVFPFLYVVDPPDNPVPVSNPGTFNIVFVGRLVDLKGVDLLIKALQGLDGFMLNIIGDGPLRASLEQRALHTGIEKRVHWHGQLDNTQVRNHIAGADLLILPSRKDGWGAVINEALSAGTPVVCSDACGAGSLITNDLLGQTYAVEDHQSLHKIIQRRIESGGPGESDRRQIRAMTSYIDPIPVARYFERVMQHVYEHADRPSLGSERVPGT